MFKNYLKIACRNLLKYKTHSFINIAGLSIGMACCILILLYVQDEMSFDKWHANSDRIYRVTREWLNTFAFRVDISLLVFAWAALLALLIAIATVSFQSIKAALVNPVTSLRNE